MKGKSILRGLFAAMSLVLVMPFFSCSNVSNGSSSESGTVSFSLDKEFIQKAFDAAKRKNISLNTDLSEEPAEEPAGEVITLRFEISLQGDYTDSKSVQASEERANEERGDADGTHGMDGLHGGFKFSSQTVSFENVPVGKKIWAKVKVFQVSQRDNPHPFMIGKSNEITVQAETEQNKLTVAVCNYYAFIPFSFTVKYETAPDFSLSMNQILACDPDCVFIKKLRAAKDNGDRFEICKNYQYDDGLLGLSNIDPSDTESVKIEGDTAIVSDIMYLPVSEDDPNAKGTDVVFVLLSFKSEWNEQTQTSVVTPVYFAITEGSVSPIKTQTNAVSLNASDLAVVDTSYALYKKSNGSGYNYYIMANPSDSLTGTAISSSGTDGTTDGKTHSFCFDRDGKFYTLSITPDSGEVYIYSNNLNIGTDGAYECKDGDGNPMSFDSIACDIKRSELFALKRQGDNTYVLYGTGDFIKSGINAQTAYVLKPQGFDLLIRKMFAIQGGVGYFVGRSSEGGWYLLKTDLARKTDSAYNYGQTTYDVDSEIVAEIPLPSGATVSDYEPELNFTDMIYQEGAVYLLYKEIEDNIDDKSYNSGELYYKSRGALIKCDVSTKSVKTIGWTDDAMDNSIASFATYYLSSSAYGYFTESCAPWTDESKRFVIPGNTSIKWLGSSSFIRDSLPKIYSPSASAASKAFYGPQKFIAIKPKQLVIADNGTYFYTDSVNGGYRFKNAKRVVTVDLEKFAITDCTDNNEAFSNVVTGSIYTNAFGNINTYLSIIPDSAEGKGLYITNNSRFTPTSQGDYPIHLGIPYVGEN